ncbi:MAG TPA: hypothetical protein ENN65_01015, partial [Candidatus Hydrogenedentes bacterium]|nr:hypothetical protein [Candidatus Hydrogenedentota bacterium]
LMPGQVIDGGESEAILNHPNDGEIISRLNMELLLNGWLAKLESDKAAYEAGNLPEKDLYEDDFSHDAFGNIPAGTVYRLREGIERFFITDINNPAASAVAQSEVVVMWDQVWGPAVVPGDGGAYSAFNHVPGGGNILFMDGHVEFLRYPGRWPVCKAYVLLMDLMSAAIVGP